MSLRTHVKEKSAAYLRADTKEKTDITNDIFSVIATKGGRFIHFRDGVYYEIARKRANEKIRASLRAGNRAIKYNTQEDSESVSTAGLEKATVAKSLWAGRNASKVKAKIRKVASYTATTGRTTANSLRLKLKDTTVAAIEQPVIIAPGKIHKTHPRSSTKATTKRSNKRPKTKAKAHTTKKKVGRPKSKKLTRTNKSTKIPATSPSPMATSTTEAFHPEAVLAATAAATMSTASETTAFVPVPPMLQESHSLFLDSLPFPQGHYFPTAMECFGEDGTDDNGAHDDLDVDMDAHVVDFEWSNSDTMMNLEQEQEQSQSIQTEQIRNVVSPASISGYDVPDGIFSCIVPSGQYDEFSIHGSTASAFYRDNFPSLFQKESEHERQRQCQREVQDEEMTQQEFYDSQNREFRRRHDLQQSDLIMEGSTEAHSDSIVTMPSEFLDLQNNLLMNVCENEYAHETTAGGSTFFPSVFQN